MLFDKFPNYEGFRDTDRKRAGVLRKQRAERDAYPLFATQVAAEQPSVDSVMEKRRVLAMSSLTSQRDFNAKWWRKARAKYFELSQEEKAQVRDRWQRWVGPRNQSCLMYLMSEVQKSV